MPEQFIEMPVSIHKNYFPLIYFFLMNFLYSGSLLSFIVILKCVGLWTARVFFISYVHFNQHFDKWLLFKYSEVEEQRKKHIEGGKK